MAKIFAKIKMKVVTLKGKMTQRVMEISRNTVQTIQKMFLLEDCYYWNCLKCKENKKFIKVRQERWKKDCESQ